MIKKIVVILLCCIILFPAFILAGGKARQLKVNEEIRIFNGSWLYIEALQKGDKNEYIGYKGMFSNSSGTYIKFSQFYNSQEFQPIIHRYGEKIMCIGPYAFEPLEVKPQFIRLKFLGNCVEIFTSSNNKELEFENKTDGSSFIKK